MNDTYKISVVTPLKTSRERGAVLSPCDVGRMLEALSVLPEKQGRSQAAPLAAGVKPGRIRCRARPVPRFLCKMLRASYILEQEQGDKTAPLSRRPQSHKMQQIIRNCYISLIYPVQYSVAELTVTVLHRTAPAWYFSTEVPPKSVAVLQKLQKNNPLKRQRLGCIPLPKGFKIFRSL